jgi:acetoacetyl-CoA synthetase
MTLTRKKMEVPVRKILLGAPVEQAANRNAMANPDSLDFFVDYAKMQKDYSLAADHVLASEKTQARTMETTDGR